MDSNNCPPLAFMKEIECEYDKVLYHWLSRGKFFKQFFALRHEIEVFMTEKSNPVSEFSNPLRQLGVNNFTNDLNIKLQGKNKSIYLAYLDVNAFQSKLQLFIQQVEREILLHFPTCSELKKERINV